MRITGEIHAKHVEPSTHVAAYEMTATIQYHYGGEAIWAARSH